MRQSQVVNIRVMGNYSWYFSKFSWCTLVRVVWTKTDFKHHPKERIKAYYVKYIMTQGFYITQGHLLSGVTELPPDQALRNYLLEASLPSTPETSSWGREVNAGGQDLWRLYSNLKYFWKLPMLKLIVRMVSVRLRSCLLTLQKCYRLVRRRKTWGRQLFSSFCIVMRNIHSCWHSLVLLEIKALIWV